MIYANQSNSTLLTVAFNFTLYAVVRDNDTVQVVLPAGVTFTPTSQCIVPGNTNALFCKAVQNNLIVGQANTSGTIVPAGVNALFAITNVLVSSS